MSEIYYALIIFPILFIAVMTFIFQDSVAEIELQQLKFNCPYPIINQNITNLNVNGAVVTYNQTFDDTPTKVVVFTCGANGAGSASSATYEFASGWFDAGQGWLAYFSDSMSAFFQKVEAFGRMAYLMINAPAEVTGLSFFTYINAILIGFIAFGAFMVVRG